MTYETRCIYRDEYECTSINQHGPRYKRTGTKQIRVLTLSCPGNESELDDLICIGHMLNVPVHYDFKNHIAYIEVISAEAI